MIDAAAILRGLLGLVSMVGIAFALSRNRSKFPTKIVVWGIGLQFLFALIILPESLWVSWLGGFLFLSLVMVYTFEDKFAREAPAQTKGMLALAVTGCFLAAIALLTLLSQWLDGAEGIAGAMMLKVLAGASLSALAVGIVSRIGILSFGGFATLIPVVFALSVRQEVGGAAVMKAVAEKVEEFLRLSDVGSQFLFGNLANPEHYFTDGTTWPGFGFQFAFRVLPTIIFFSSFISILYYLGVMQFLVSAMAHFMRWTLGTSGAETLSCSANIFVGQTEAPFLIKPYIKDMTLSELNAVMVGGFATIAGGVLAAYISFGVPAEHLIAASVMSAPAALVVAKLMFPETEHSKTAGDVDMPVVERPENILDAASKGVAAGLQLALNVGAMLIAFIALIAFVDWVLGGMDSLIDGQLLGMEKVNGHYDGFFPASVKSLFGHLLAPVAWLLGAEWGEEAFGLGHLLGAKIAVNEFVAYSYLGTHIQEQSLSPRTIVLASYALCGFANFASIGIQIGGIGVLAPERRTDLAKIAFRAMIGGALASWMTAAIAGMLVA